jgi:hypothetical protein
MPTLSEHAKYAASRVKTSYRRAINRRNDWSRYRTVSDLCSDHFRLRSSPDHINRGSMTSALESLGGRPATIVETGVSCRGTDSTRLFDSYIRSFGGSFASVDIDPEVVAAVQDDLSEHSTATCQDSVSFLHEFAGGPSSEKVDFVYLDSYDVDFEDPLPAAEHCLEEFFAILPRLREGAIVLIDDSPSELELVPLPSEGIPAAHELLERYGNPPGKGMLLESVLEAQGILRRKPGYQALYVIEYPSSIVRP